MEWLLLQEAFAELYNVVERRWGRWAALTFTVVSTTLFIFCTIALLVYLVTAEVPGF